jgi:AraC-like DNA-binding protein
LVKSIDLKIYREITHLKSTDVFVIAHHKEPTFNYPLHNHPEYELCLTLNNMGTRIVGDSVAKYSKKDLVLVGPYIYHRWDNEDSPEKSDDAATIVLQFGNQLFESSLLGKEAFYAIKKMLHRSMRGIQFEGPVFDIIANRLIKLSDKTGFEAVLEFLEILNILANSPDQKLLASSGFHSNPEEFRSNRINEVYEFIMKNYTKRILVNEAADIANMSESAFSHYFKKCTNKNFTKFIIELRIGHACKLLMETQNTISQICFECGFNNISNFNRLFKKYKKITPLQYRQKLETSFLNEGDSKYRFIKEQS